MRIQHYESAVIINASLEDEQINEIVQKIKALIESNGGTITSLDLWGRKRLAYMINKNRIGYYAIYRFEAPVTIIGELERFYRLDENIIRYLTIKLTKEALEFYEEQKQKAEQEEADAAAEKAEAEEPVKEGKDTAEDSGKSEAAKEKANDDAAGDEEKEAEEAKTETEETKPAAEETTESNDSEAEQTAEDEKKPS